MKDLTKLAEPLLIFWKCINMTRDVLVSHEEPRRIKYYNPEFKTESFKVLTLSILMSLSESYGDAFSASFQFAEQKLEVNSSLNQDAFDEFSSVVKNTPILQFRLELKKNLLAEELFNTFLQIPSVAVFPYEIILFFFIESMNKALMLDIEKIETMLWESSGYKKVILLTPEYEVNLNGPYLSILGGQSLQIIGEILNQPKPARESIESMYNQSQELLRWKGVDIKHLTPLHFKVKGTSSDAYRAICLNRAKMIIFYTADQTTLRSKGSYLSVFSSDKQRNEIVLNDLSHLSNEQIDIGSSKLLELVEWIYSSSKVEDSLYLFQLVVVKVLQITDPNDSYHTIFLKADYIAKELKWLWKSFTEGKIDNYMSQVKSLEDYVVTTIQSFSDQVSLMIKSLSDTMLTTIGVALASFIAALFKDKFDPTIFRIGMISYAVYLIILPLFCNMKYQKEYFKVLFKSFIRRRNRFNSILDPSKVDGIIRDQLKESKKRFRHWFNLACTTYITVAMIALLSAIFIPAAFQASTVNQGVSPSISPSSKTQVPASSSSITTPSKSPKE